MPIQMQRGTRSSLSIINIHGAFSSYSQTDLLALVPLYVTECHSVLCQHLVLLMLLLLCRTVCSTHTPGRSTKVLQSGGVFFCLRATSIFHGCRITHITSCLFLFWFQPSSQFNSVLVHLKCHDSVLYLQVVLLFEIVRGAPGFQSNLAIMFEMNKQETARDKGLWQLDERH